MGPLVILASFCLFGIDSEVFKKCANLVILGHYFTEKAFAPSATITQHTTHNMGTP